MEKEINRYWVSWWSGFYENEGCTLPPFQIWISGHRDRSDGQTEVSICTMIDAECECEIWKVVDQHFPDYEERFCDKRRNNDAVPESSRFPGFENRTSLHPEDPHG